MNMPSAVVDLTTMPMPVQKKRTKKTALYISTKSA